MSRRVATILEVSTSKQLNHVHSELNAADAGFGSFDVESNWSIAPKFLSLSERHWPSSGPHENFFDGHGPEDSKESQKCSFITASSAQPVDCLSQFISRFSGWTKLLRAVAYLKKFLTWLGNKTCSKEISVNDLSSAESSIIRYAQQVHYSQEIHRLRTGNKLPVSHPLRKLEVHLDENDLLRVGGRLACAPVPESSKYQILLPPKSHVALLIVRHIHSVQALHSGSEYVLSLLRQKYWIPQGRRLVRNLVRKCITCCRLNARPCVQRMADLPPARVSISEKPFNHTGIDCFGPFLVKLKRSSVKRYGCIFTCLTTRAIHLEVLSALDTNSFINALFRFISRRGRPSHIFSDHGTNFVGACHELGKALKECQNKQTLRRFLLNHSIEWCFNPPTASHMGGAWERLIRSVRRVLNTTIRNTKLTDDELMTIFAQVEFIINNRPITKVSEDINDAGALTPNHFLTMSELQPTPSVVSHSGDQFRRRWRFVQHLLDHFWTRWTREYLPIVQHRQKWLNNRRQIREGDLVIVVNDIVHRNHWPLGLVVKVFKGRDNLVRSCQIKTKNSLFTRPVQKLCLLEMSD